MSSPEDPRARPGNDPRTPTTPEVGPVEPATMTPDDVTAAASRVVRRGATDRYEAVYAQADGDAGAVPWAAQAPHAHLVGWLDQPGLDVTDVDAVVVGAGLGDDAVELARRGCRVTAFDISPTAVAWAQERTRGATYRHPIDWRVVDLLELPADMVGAFGLVVEVRTVQSLPGSIRDEAMLAIAALVGADGWLVATTLLATSDEAARTWEGPPWAQAPAELAAYRAGGLERITLDHPPLVEPAPPAMDVRLVLHRPPRPADTVG